MKISLIVIAGLCLLQTVPVRAQAVGNPQNWCRNGIFPGEPVHFRLAVIVGMDGERIHFYDDTGENCPGGESCRLKIYVIPGDVVIVTHSFGEWACCWYQPKQGDETVGWIRWERLKFKDENKNPGLEAWVGEWAQYDTVIRIAPNPERGILDVDGNAVWHGFRENTHVGRFEGSAMPQGDILIISEGSGDEWNCSVRIQLLGRFLIVSDNFKCGGANVTFAGVYQRRSR